VLQELRLKVEDHRTKNQDPALPPAAGPGGAGSFFALRSSFFIPALAVATLAVLPVASCRPAPAQPVRGGASADAAAPTRIVSLAPSVTEVLFALGLGDRVVGVTRFCRYPADAERLPDVGGYLDLNLEAIVALEPDLVIAIQDHDAARARLEDLGLSVLQVDQESLAGILDSITTIADSCGVSECGGRLADDVRGRLHEVERRVSGLERPRVLAVVGREAGHGTLATVWVAGRKTFYDDLIGLAGGTNVAPASSVAYPEVSREGLYHLDPDVILDLLADLDDRGVDAASAASDWRDLPTLGAVRTGRVHAVVHELAVVPGPRVAELVEELARAIHPEAFR
jgi:iron complex transport system substrate-binding protein